MTGNLYSEIYKYIDGPGVRNGANMRTFKLYTFSQIVTVKNCANYAEALHKTGFFDSEIWKVVEVEQ